jgi:phytoene desaturase
METLSKSLGVNFVTSANVTKISVENNTANGIYVNDNFIASDLVLSGADYAHTEQLLPKNNRQYTDKYWEKKTFAPSSLLFYVAFDKPIENVEHHTLFFDTDFEAHAKSIYDTPEWPKKPLFYASFPSKTDETIAPKGKEAATFLIPLAPGIEDSDEIREIYFDKIIERLEYLTKQEVKSHIIFKESYGIDNFIEDYNSYKGNAYGLANTLFQTAFLRPKLKSKKVNGLYFTGQLTVPGPGVPPSLISGKLTADLINKYETNL